MAPSLATAPRKLRRLGRPVAVLAVLVALLTGCMSPGQQETLDLVNVTRAAHGLPAVHAHGQLQDKAQAWAEQLAREGRLRHSRLRDGVSDCWRRLGENVGYGASVSSVHAAYLASPGHRANILNRDFDAIGTGVATNGHRTYTVQVFMQRC